MARILVGIGVIFVFAGLAPAEIFTSNCRLDHALWPGHDAKLVVAGEILSPQDGAMRLRVSSVILGASSYKGQVLKIPARSFTWPIALVSFKKGTSCILVLQLWDEEKGKEWYLHTVVPGRKRAYRRARDTNDARAVVAEELLAQLEGEKSQVRQRELLLQLAPVLPKDKAGGVKGFLKSPNPSVRRAALAALVYATEEAKYLEAMAKDVQTYFAKTKGTEWVDGLEAGIQVRPKTLLLRHYFFLERSTWTFGTRWDEREAEKHLRILKGMLDKGVLDEKMRKRLVEDE
jgi:hypothetical protein